MHTKQDFQKCLIEFSGNIKGAAGRIGKSVCTQTLTPEHNMQSLWRHAFRMPRTVSHYTTIAGAREKLHPVSEAFRRLSSGDNIVQDQPVA